MLFKNIKISIKKQILLYLVFKWLLNWIGLSCRLLEEKVSSCITLNNIIVTLPYICFYKFLFVSNNTNSVRKSVLLLNTLIT